MKSLIDCVATINEPVYFLILLASCPKFFKISQFSSSINKWNSSATIQIGFLYLLSNLSLFILLVTTALFKYVNKLII